MKIRSALADWLAIAAYAAIIVALVYGWTANIVTIAHSNFFDLTGLLVLRVVGIFIAPLGTVLGYM